MSASSELRQEAERPASPYELLGGETGLRRLIDAFYRIMDEDPEAAGIRAMHAADLSPISQSLFEWLSGWLGGPPLYIMRKGTPCLTGPHKAFAIGPAERDQWLYCMRRALDEIGIDANLQRMFEEPFFRIADMVRNRE